MEKPTQKMTILYQLVENKLRGNLFIPVYGFMGETYIKPLKMYGWVSYEVAARMCDINKENPGLLERKLHKGKSGAWYYAYRLASGNTAHLISDPILYDFYKLL